jgi:hypothetical protein
MSSLVLKRASTSRPSGEWNDDDFDVLADGAVVGRILKVHAALLGAPWMWTLADDARGRSDGRSDIDAVAAQPLGLRPGVVRVGQDIGDMDLSRTWRNDRGSLLRAARFGHRQSRGRLKSAP